MNKMLEVRNIHQMNTVLWRLRFTSRFQIACIMAEMMIRVKAAFDMLGSIAEVGRRGEELFHLFQDWRILFIKLLTVGDRFAIKRDSAAQLFATEYEPAGKRLREERLACVGPRSGPIHWIVLLQKPRKKF